MAFLRCHAIRSPLSEADYFVWILSRMIGPPEASFLPSLLIVFLCFQDFLYSVCFIPCNIKTRSLKRKSLHFLSSWNLNWLFKPGICTNSQDFHGQFIIHTSDSNYFTVLSLLKCMHPHQCIKDKIFIFTWNLPSIEFIHITEILNTYVLSKGKSDCTVFYHVCPCDSGLKKRDHCWENFLSEHEVFLNSVMLLSRPVFLVTHRESTKYTPG